MNFKPKIDKKRTPYQNKTTMTSELLNHLTELLSSANEKQRQEIADMLSNMNVNNRNNENVKQFTKNILKKENHKKHTYVQFLESTSVNALIYAPTQVGKSSATREFIETCFQAGVPVIVSTDNKTDQCEQLYTRIEKELCGADVKMMKVADKSFGEDLKNCIKNEMHRFVIFCLDNSTQIEKLIVNLTSLATRHQQQMQKLSKIAIVHDEADQITKDRDTDVVSDDQAESHKKWIELMDLINKTMGYMDLKRVFVTASPENCVMLYKIESVDVITLEIPSTYVGYKDIEYIQLEDDLDIKMVLKNEVRRIKADGTFEAILYCIDRKIVDGHDKVLDSLASVLKCTVSTYNGHGITAFMRTLTLAKKFEAVLKRQDIPYKKQDKYFTTKNLAIRKFYTICKKLGENCVITIGKDLISRGISYVSEDKHEPLTATTMIYKPGMTMHAVGITQTIGRVTGCAMPSLKRRVYAPKDVIETYQKYNKNQEEYIKTMLVKRGLTKDIISEIQFEKLKRHIDRAKLGLKMQTKSEERFTGDHDRMKQLIDMWWNADTIIGKILRFVYESKVGVSETELKTYIKECGSTDYTKLYTHLITGGKEYKLIFERTDSRVTKIREEAKLYIESL